MATYPLSQAYADGDVLSAANINSITDGVNDIAFGVFNTQTATTYTLALADVAKVVTLSNASAITLTVPPNSSVAFPVGTQIVLAQLGAGQVTIAPGSGVTLNSFGTALKVAGQYGVATCLKTATDTWLVFGNLTA
jgi:hypothetical protein